MKAILTTQAPSAIGPYSQAIATDKYLFLSGQIPIVPETGQIIAGGIKEQTQQVILNIKALLTAAGCCMNDVVKTLCFLSSMDNFALFNEVYAQHFSNKPARSCIAISALPRDALVEIEVIAEIPQKQITLHELTE